MFSLLVGDHQLQTLKTLGSVGDGSEDVVKLSSVLKAAKAGGPEYFMARVCGVVNAVDVVVATVVVVVCGAAVLAFCFDLREIHCNQLRAPSSELAKS